MTDAYREQLLYAVRRLTVKALLAAAHDFFDRYNQRPNAVLVRRALFTRRRLGVRDPSSHDFDRIAVRVHDPRGTQ